MSGQAKSGERPWWMDDPWLGHHLYWQNRERNLHLLPQYEGLCVAWMPDGSGIRGAHEDMHALWKQIEASGEDPQWYLYEYIPIEPTF